MFHIIYPRDYDVRLPPCTKDKLKKKDQQRIYLMTFMRFFNLIFFIKAHVVGTHLNCIDKYTGCNLKITELLDCVLIVVCAVIKSNTVVFEAKNLICNYNYHYDCCI